MHTTYRNVLIISLVFGSMAACTLPFARTPTPFFSPTPNLTMTALFAPTETPLPTQAVVLTSTLPPQPTAFPTFTPTSPPPSPSPTQIPPTPTPIPDRTGGDFEAAFLSSPPTIDGVWDEWTNKAYPARSIPFGEDNWTGPEDLELSFRLGWDNDNLYLAVKVKDDAYVQNASGQDLFKGDSIELLLDVDLDGDFSDNRLSNDDFQLGISPGKPDVDGEKEAYIWYPTSHAGAQSQVEIASVHSSGVYRVEAAIPWSLVDVDPSAGQTFGFAISASDNDNPNENIQQSMASSAEERKLNDPTSWGELVLKQ